MKKPLFAFLPFLLWIVLIFVLLVMPARGNEPVFRIPHLDKLAHAFVFCVMVFLFGWPYRHQLFKRNSLKIFIVALFACVYGIAMEFVQKYALTYPRSYDEWDMLADCIGAFAGFFAIRKVILYFNEREVFKRENFS